MLTEFLAVQLNKAVPVPVFLTAHLVQDRRRGRVVGFEALGEVALNSGIFFFERDGQRQNHLLAQALKGSHGVRSRTSFRLAKSK